MIIIYNTESAPAVCIINTFYIVCNEEFYFNLSMDLNTAMSRTVNIQ